MKSMFHAGFLIFISHFFYIPCANLMHICVHCFARKSGWMHVISGENADLGVSEQLEIPRLGAKKHPKGCYGEP